MVNDYEVEQHVLMRESLFASREVKEYLISQKTPDISEVSAFHRIIRSSYLSLKYQCYQHHINSCLLTTVLAHIVLFNTLARAKHVPACCNRCIKRVFIKKIAAVVISGHVRLS
jgi:hypothetical protein